MKSQQCTNCIFSNWYKNFKSITFKSKIIHLSSEFVDYLKKDGIILPDDEKVKYSNDLERYSDEEDDDDDEWNDKSAVQNISMFPDLKIEVENAINILGKDV